MDSFQAARFARPSYIESTNLSDQRLLRSEKSFPPNLVFSSFKSKLVHSFRSESDDGIFVRLHSDDKVLFDPSMNLFIEKYRTLPLAARAKLENWNISREHIALKSLVDSEEHSGLESYTAMFHGLEVLATIHSNTLEDSITVPRLHKEISAMAQIRHPNIVGFIGASISSSSCIVITELMSCGSLRSFYLAKQTIRHKWRPSKDKTLAWSLDLARAVNYLHQSEPAIHHRDLRPETVFVGQDGALKVSGFGRCAVLRQLPDAVDAGLHLGDAATAGARLDAASLDQRQLEIEAQRSASVYMAPEMLAEPTTTTDRVDIYSVAALIWFIRAGRDPDWPLAAGISRRGRPTKRVARSPGSRLPASFALLSWPQLAEVVSRASDPAFAERPSADELVEDLEAVRCGGGRDADRCSPQPPHAHARSGCMPWLRAGACLAEGAASPRPAARPPLPAAQERWEEAHVVSSLVLR